MWGTLQKWILLVFWADHRKATWIAKVFIHITVRVCEWFLFSRTALVNNNNTLFQFRLASIFLNNRSALFRPHIHSRSLLITSTVASPGFFSAGWVRPYHLKAITRPRRGSGTLAKFHFLKRFNVLEMNRVFKNIYIFLAQKAIFSKKNFEKLNIFHRHF